MDFSSPAVGRSSVHQRLIFARSASMLDDIKAKKFVVVSFDTLPEEFKILKQGACNALIGQRPYAMGVKSIDVLNDLTEGKTVPAVVDTGVDVVTAANVDQFLK